MAVLGSSLTQTVVVSTRSTALVAAQICRRLKIFPLTIDILEEIDHSERLTVNNGQKTTEKFGNMSSSYFAEGEARRALSMIEFVTITNQSAFPAVNKRLKSWSYYDGLGDEVIN